MTDRAQRAPADRPRPAARPRMPKASERVASQLFNEIIDAGLPEGHSLPSEVELAEHMGVGRMTARQALRLLESRGAVAVRTGPGGGPSVRRPQPRDLSTALIITLQSEGATLGDALAARELLEPVLVANAAQTMGDDDIDRLEGTVHAILADLDDHQRFLDETHEFNRLIVVSSGSAILSLVLEAIATITADTIPEVPYDRERRRQVAIGRQQIVDAVRAHDPEAAAEATRTRLRQATSFWTDVYPDLSERPIRWHV